MTAKELYQIIGKAQHGDYGNDAKYWLARINLLEIVERNGYIAVHYTFDKVSYVDGVGLVTVSIWSTWTIDDNTEKTNREIVESIVKSASYIMTRITIEEIKVKK